VVTPSETPTASLKLRKLKLSKINEDKNTNKKLISKLISSFKTKVPMQIQMKEVIFDPFYNLYFKSDRTF
jgi:hypothetical protein